MIREPSRFDSGICLALVLCLLACQVTAASGSHGSRKKGRTVWVVFFSSHDCPHCERVKELLNGLKSTYPVRTKVFDIVQDKDYQLFRKLESIHGDGEFAVPLVMVGESIIQGEDQIAAKLEPTIRRLSRGRGAPLPYLGEQTKGKASESKAPLQRCPTCEDKRRPPSLQEEMGNIKVLFDKYF